MAFEFKLSTDEIRKKMFDFIKPVYKNTWDFEVGYINWIYGVYDRNTKRNYGNQQKKLGFFDTVGTCYGSILAMLL